MGVAHIRDRIKKAKTIKPQVDLDADPDTQIETTLTALQVANDPPHLFRRGSMIARVRPYRGEPAAIEGVGSDALFAEITRTIECVRIGKKKEVTKHYPPDNLMRALRGSGELPYPPLNGLRRAPFYTAKGVLVSKPGYDAPSGIYYSPDPNLKSMAAIPLSPDADDLKRAKEHLHYPIHQFPFASAASYAHAIALEVLPFAREMIVGPLPIIAVTAAAPRHGKDKLIVTQCVPALGCEVPQMPELGKGEELRKRLTSLVLSNEPIAVFANVNQLVAGGPLAAILTASTWSDRILGRSEMVKLPVRNAWVISANNPRFSRELLLRTIPIRLDANVENPGRRKFHDPEDPVAYALAHRSELVWACLVLIQNWICSGRPKATLPTRLGGFESFTEVIGGILAAAGIPDFLGNLDSFQADSDGDADQWRPFISEWWRSYHESAVSPTALLEIGDRTDFARPAEGAESERSRITKFGLRIAHHADRVFDIFPDGEASEAKSVKIVRSEYERDNSRRHRGYALKLAKATSPEPLAPSRGVEGHGEVGDVGDPTEPRVSSPVVASKGWGDTQPGDNGEVEFDID